MSILDTLNLDLDAFAGFNDPSLFEGKNTTTLRLGKRVPYSGSIPGAPAADGTPTRIEIPCYVTLREAKLTRLTLLEQDKASQAGSKYWLVTGIFKPVKLDLELVIDGETINLVDFLHQVASKASGTTMGREEFILNARRIGFNFEDGMPLFWQQFGASLEGFQKTVDAFKHAGATDEIGSIKGDTNRIKAVYAHAEGVPVTSFELGTVDRSQSPRNQGFLNLLDAQMDQFTRILGLRKAARGLRNQIIEAGTDAKQDDTTAMKAKAAELDSMSRQWMSSWSGAQKRIEKQTDGTLVTQNQFDPVSAPCGRFTLNTTDGEVACDLWRNSARANGGEVSTPAAKVVAVVPDGEDPF